MAKKKPAKKKAVSKKVARKQTASKSASTVAVAMPSDIGAAPAELGTPTEITAASMGTEVDIEWFYLPDKDVVVGRFVYLKAWATLTWESVEQFVEDVSMSEMRSDKMSAEIDFSERHANHEEWIGAESLQDDDAFQQMLNDKFDGELKDYCWDHGEDPWGADLPENRTKDLEESHYRADRVPIYDIRVAWPDGSTDIFTAKEQRLHVVAEDSLSLKACLAYLGS